MEGPVTFHAFAKLNGFFSNMEALLRPHLQQLARSEGVQPKNPQDVRLLLDELASVWPKRKGKHSIYAKQFHNIRMVLNRYHHTEPTPWATLDKGVMCAVLLLKVAGASGGAQQMIAAWKAVEREGELAYAITDADTFTAAQTTQQQSPTSSGKKEKKKKKTQKKSGKKLVVQPTTKKVPTTAQQQLQRTASTASTATATSIPTACPAKAGPTATSTTATATATSTPTATAVSATPSQLYETWIGHAEAAFHREHMLPRLRLPQGELLEIVEMAKRAVVVRASSRAVVERCLPKLTYIDLSYRDLIVGEDATNILTTHLKEIAAAAGVPVHVLPHQWPFLQVQVWLRAADDDRVRYRLESVKLLQFQLSQAEVVRQVLHELTYNSARPSIWAFVGKTNVVVLFDQDHDGERRENFEAWVHHFQNNPVPVPDEGQGWGLLASAVLPAAMGVLLGVFLMRRK